MKAEELKNYGKAYTQTLEENSKLLQKLIKKEASPVVRRHLGPADTMLLRARGLPAQHVD